MIDKPLPSAHDVERALLGSCLQDNRHIPSAVMLIAQQDFALDSHRRIYGRLVEMDAGGKSVDIATLADELGRRSEVQAIGGVAYLSSLTEGLPRRPSIDGYARIVKEKARLRKIIQLADRAQAMAYDQSEPIGIVASIQDDLEAILDDRSDDNPHVSAYSVATLDKFEQDRKLDRPSGLSYGLAPLDAKTGGMRPGEVCIVGARPGVGKTSLLCQAVAANCAAGIPCHVFSLEMTRQQILHRLWAIVSGVPYKRISDPWLSNVDDAARIRSAASVVAEWPLRIDDQSEMHLSQLTASARVSIRRHGTRFVGIDYAQEVTADGKDEKSKTMAVARGIARMIKHEPATVMLLSQLVKGNRDSYNRPPIVADLVESGKLEQIAHVVLLLHRGWDEDAGRIANDAEILVPKQRRGDTGTIPARFDRRSVTFEAV